MPAGNMSELAVDSWMSMATVLTAGPIRRRETTVWVRKVSAGAYGWDSVGARRHFWREKRRFAPTPSHARPRLDEAALRHGAVRGNRFG